MLRRVSSSSCKDGWSFFSSAASQSSHSPAVLRSCSSSSETPACRVAFRAASLLRISLWASFTASSLFSSAANVVVFPATAGSDAARFIRDLDRKPGFSLLRVTFASFLRSKSFSHVSCLSLIRGFKSSSRSIMSGKPFWIDLRAARFSGSFAEGCNGSRSETRVAYRINRR